MLLNFLLMRTRQNVRMHGSSRKKKLGSRAQLLTSFLYCAANSYSGRINRLSAITVMQLKRLITLQPFASQSISRAESGSKICATCDAIIRPKLFVVYSLKCKPVKSLAMAQHRKKNMSMKL